MYYIPASYQLSPIEFGPLKTIRQIHDVPHLFNGSNLTHRYQVAKKKKKKMENSMVYSSIKSAWALAGRINMRRQHDSLAYSKIN